MEWLSEEEKSRSMMPYLLDLPPLDVNGDQAKKSTTTEKDEFPVKTKTASKKKAKEIEVEKWHCLVSNSELDKQSDLPFIVSSNTNTKKMNCDTNHKPKYDFKISYSKKFIMLTDRDMDQLRRLSRNTK